VSMTAGGGILLDTISVASANTVIGSGSTLTLNSNLNAGSWYVQAGTGATLDVAAGISMPYLLLSGGLLTGNGSLTVTNNIDWSAGTMGGTGTTTLAAGAFAGISGSVMMDRTMVNNGEYTVGTGGSVGVGGNFSLQNNGLFTLQGTGGFAGGAGTIVNNGTFRKGVASTTPPPPTTATVDVASFVNTTAGVVQVVAGDSLVFPGNFMNNSGVIALDAGTKLDTMGAALTSSGVIKGHGTLDLGTGILTNLGKLSPGGDGTVGTLSIVADTVNMEGGSVLHADLTDGTTYDILQVSKDIVFKSGVTVAAVTPAAPAAGTTYDVVRSSVGIVSGLTPVVSTTSAGAQFTATHVAAPQSLRLVAGTAPGTGTTTANAEVTSLVVQFIAAFERTLAQLEEEEEKAGQASDNLVNDTSCKPAT
jgi:hypothetical protein